MSKITHKTSTFYIFCVLSYKASIFISCACIFDSAHFLIIKIYSLASYNSKMHTVNIILLLTVFDQFVIKGLKSQCHEKICSTDKTLTIDNT